MVRYMYVGKHNVERIMETMTLHVDDSVVQILFLLTSVF